LDESFAAPQDETSLESALEYCVLQVRTFDPDRYLIAIAAPKEFRTSLFVLYAFNLEISKTRETVSEPMLGRIRLQWWREAIEGIYQRTPRNHEVVLALAFVIENSSLNRQHLEDMIDGREFDLEDREPEDIPELVSYAQQTSGSLLQLTAEVLSVDKVASNRIGVAWALIGLMKAIQFHRSQQRCYLPGIPVSQIGSDKAVTVFADILEIATQHLDQKAPKLDGAIGLYQWIARHDLKLLMKIKEAPFESRPTNKAWRRCRIVLASLLRG
jgi:phytoene/squalene synthetase